MTICDRGCFTIDFVSTAVPLATPRTVSSIGSVAGWSTMTPAATYPSRERCRVAAPAIARALVAAGATSSRSSRVYHSLERVYLELVGAGTWVVFGAVKARIRIRAVIRKEFQEYRRNRFIIYTMGTLPLIFTRCRSSHSSVSPTRKLFNREDQVAITLLLLLVIPVVCPRRSRRIQ